MTEIPRFSIVVPVLNEAEAVGPLTREIAAACAPIGPFEAIFVDDGSTDGTANRITEMQAEFPWLCMTVHAQTFGQSAALRSGVIAARASVICTIDGDGQNPPSEIPKLVSPLLIDEHGLDDSPVRRLGLVAGQRIRRRDSLSKQLASHLANRLRTALLHDDTRDTGCGLKAFPRAVFLDLPFFDHMHRYLPALVRREGLDIQLVDVAHRARLTGTSKYTNTGRALAGVQDLLGVWWLMHRHRLAVSTRAKPANRNV
ncbi:MAG TPA: glycosyltransferase family 2 protein [Thermohalobaculum sp.]|nr:glycosyltransferase family 2 protein [Thermohalobaculum sp.]